MFIYTQRHQIQFYSNSACAEHDWLSLCCLAPLSEWLEQKVDGLEEHRSKTEFYFNKHKADDTDRCGVIVIQLHTHRP